MYRIRSKKDSPEMWRHDKEVSLVMKARCGKRLVEHGEGVAQRSLFDWISIFVVTAVIFLVLMICITIIVTVMSLWDNMDGVESMIILITVTLSYWLTTDIFYMCRAHDSGVFYSDLPFETWKGWVRFVLFFPLWPLFFWNRRKLYSAYAEAEAVLANDKVINEEVYLPQMSQEEYVQHAEEVLLNILDRNCQQKESAVKGLKLRIEELMDQLERATADLDIAEKELKKFRSYKSTMISGLKVWRKNIWQQDYNAHIPQWFDWSRGAGDSLASFDVYTVVKFKYEDRIYYAGTYIIRFEENGELNGEVYESGMRTYMPSNINEPGFHMYALLDAIYKICENHNMLQKKILEGKFREVLEYIAPILHDGVINRLGSESEIPEVFREVAQSE